MDHQDLNQSLDYLRSELNRIETMAGTLSTTEREHFNRLSEIDNREMMDIAVEEQNAARQLGTIKQMCLAMAQTVDSIKINLKENSGSSDHD